MTAAVLAPNEANTLLAILLENAEITRDGLFLREFSDVDPNRGEYSFSGEYSDFQLIAKVRDNGQSYWELTKHEAQTLDGDSVISLRENNEALLLLYARV